MDEMLKRCYHTKVSAEPENGWLRLNGTVMAPQDARQFAAEMLRLADLAEGKIPADRLAAQRDPRGERDR